MFSMSDWISVDERLPPYGQEVLLFIQTKLRNVDYDTDKEIGDSYVCKEKAIGCIKNNDLWLNYDQDGFYSVSDVTHWMPLPEPPK